MDCDRKGSSTENHGPKRQLDQDSLRTRKATHHGRQDSGDFLLAKNADGGYGANSYSAGAVVTEHEAPANHKRFGVVLGKWIPDREERVKTAVSKALVAR